MNRNYLIAAVRSAVEGLGYSFFTGPDSVLAGRINSFPTVWLSPPRLTEVRGKSERRRSYRANIYFLAEHVGVARQDEQLEVLERDADNLVAALEREEYIQRIYNAKYTPNKLPLTKNGEVGLAVEFDIEMFHCI